MRLWAAGLIAIAAAIALAIESSAQADEASPFPSPSPESTAAPGSGGYAVFGLAALSASGGLFPVANASPSATPAPFKAATASGYSIEVQGRLSDSYLAQLHFEDANIHGDDAAVESRFDVSALYVFRPTRFAAGLGLVSLQRSTASFSSNGLGAGLALVPDFSQRLSPYGSLFYYPGLAASDGTRAGLSVLRLGLAFTPGRASGVFARLGFSTQHFGANSFSPTSLSGAEIGVGTTF